MALGVVAASLTVVAAATWRLALPASAAGTPMSEVPLPMPDLNPPVEDGPVVITVRYHVRPDKVVAFLEAARELRRTRRRTGATHWHLHRDLADTNLFEEMFVVGSWQEHERQHERLQGRERDVLDGIDYLLQPGEPRVASHAIAIRPTARSRGGSLLGLGTVPRHRNPDAGAALLGSVLDLTADTGGWSPRAASVGYACP